MFASLFCFFPPLPPRQSFCWGGSCDVRAFLVLELHVFLIEHYIC